MHGDCPPRYTNKCTQFIQNHKSFIRARVRECVRAGARTRVRELYYMFQLLIHENSKHLRGFMCKNDL